jgi:Zn-dependent protease/CBS domain-containing protein
MQGHIKIGRVFGIQLGLHFSWLLIALLVTLSLAGHFSTVNADWGAGVIWTTAVVTGILFFGSIILHELAHALVGKMRGLPVSSITLFALGGVALIDKEADDAATEFWVGIAGPIMSVIIGVVCLLSAAALGWSPETQAIAQQTPVLAAIVWLGYINIALAVFNMIPGFPLDGGRVLRAFVWWITGDMNRSTRIAARVGQFVAVLFIVWGVFQFFSGAGFGSLWLALIGWFLLIAASGSYAQVAITQSLRGLRTSDVMRRDCETVNGRINLQEFVEENLLKMGSRCYFVVEGDRFVGLITLHEVKQVPRDEWGNKTVGDAMRPLEDLQTVAPQTPLSEALETMIRADVNQLPVINRNQLAGVISRNHVLEILKARAELKI